jgi:glyoxylase-like metal-dependent hydrolase (beta-lactamase superfamily II)
VSVFPTEPDADPLAEWLDSIERIKAKVRDDVLVLPAHNDPFRGLHSRLEALATGHLQTLEQLKSCLNEPRRAVNVFGALFARSITSEPNLLGLATGESVAHINYLLRRGEVVVAQMAKGVAWYRLAEPQERSMKACQAC